MQVLLEPGQPTSLQLQKNVQQVRLEVLQCPAWRQAISSSGASGKKARQGRQARAPAPGFWDWQHVLQHTNAHDPAAATVIPQVQPPSIDAEMCECSLTRPMDDSVRSSISFQLAGVTNITASELVQNSVRRPEV